MLSKVIVVSTKRSGPCGQKLCTFNAGAYGSDVSRIFQSAEIVLETGEWVRYSKEDMEFAYGHSVLH
ncbi:hypothetical protein [Paenibacillus sp. ACRRY]|uniref:hypothetical protein n=1 Tax=Paenibacillus sp. ACRRY TaxID=2918208 RepID=UPI001EF424AA|nr:hypothetical protein [Paenibacillus sp. ACRRY]MCG7383279.1 hypothetical protein [Paenibacillus sp. ACRRY]